MAVQTQIQTRRGTAASWTSTNPTLAAGEFGYETDTGKFKIGNGSTAWASLAYTAASTAVTYLFNATSGQTTFSGADANGLTLAYTVGAEQVYLNGVLQVRGSDYTATNGTSIVLASGALTSDVLNVIAYSAMTITDTYTQAQADAKFYQILSNGAAGKNAVINGGFDIWQRGTSFSAPNYSADRWYTIGGSTTYSQETTAANLPTGFRYGMKMLLGATNVPLIAQAIETNNSLPYAGKRVILSYYVSSTASSDCLIRLDSSTTVDNSISGTWTTLSAAAGYSATASTTSTMTRVSCAYDVPSNTQSLRILIGSNVNITNTNSMTITGVQLELGSIPTPFARAGGTIAGELAACQRYFNRFTSGPIALSNYFTTTRVLTPVVLPVQMRIAPTGITSNSAAFTNYVAGSGRASSAVVFNSATPKVLELDITTAADTAGRVGSMTLDSGSFDVSAEL